jgi:hypothetical protein
MKESDAYSVSLNVTIDDLSRLCVHRNSPGAVDKSIGDNGLAVDARKRWRSLGGEDRGLGGHLGGMMIEQQRTRNLEAIESKHSVSELPRQFKGTAMRFSGRITDG